MNYNLPPSDPDHQAFAPQDVDFINELNEPLAFHGSPHAHEAPDARAAGIFLKAEEDFVIQQKFTEVAKYLLDITTQSFTAKADTRSDLGAVTIEQAARQAAEQVATRRTFEDLVADLPDYSEDTTIPPMARVALHLADAEPRIEQQVEQARIIEETIEATKNNDDDILTVKRNTHEFGSSPNRPSKGVSLRKPPLPEPDKNQPASSADADPAMQQLLGWKPDTDNNHS